MKIHRENLISALNIAINKQREVEKKKNFFTDSALVAGWIDLLEAINKGEEIKFF